MSSSSKHLKDLDAILGSFDKMTSTSTVSSLQQSIGSGGDANDIVQAYTLESPPVEQIPPRHTHSSSRANVGAFLNRSTSHPAPFQSSLSREDETMTAAPMSPPPLPPDDDPSATVVFSMAPAPPPPISQTKPAKSIDSVIDDVQTELRKSNRSLGSNSSLRRHPAQTQVFKPPSVSVGIRSDRMELPPAPADVIKPPLRHQHLLGGLKKGTSTPSLPTHQLVRSDSQPFEGPDEIDFGPDEGDTQEEQTHRDELKRMSQAINFEKVTVDDFQDLDNLLTDLDKIFNKTNGARYPGLSQLGKTSTLPPPDDPPPLPSQPHPKLQEVPLTLKPQNQLEFTPPKLTEEEKEEKIRQAMIKLSEANIKKVATRIYIEDAKKFKTLILTSLMPAKEVTRDVHGKALLPESPDWTLFEVVNDLGIERPLRDFEIVTDVVASWGPETPNALLLKKYGYRDSLSIEGAMESFPRMCGWLYYEFKPSKWHKRFFELKSNGLYYSKDTKGTNETLLCQIANVDVYTLMRSKKKAPTKCCFAIRSQLHRRHFEKAEDYCIFLCVDLVDKMKDWVLSIRHARSQKILEDHPEYISNNPSPAFRVPSPTKMLSPQRSISSMKKSSSFNDLPPTTASSSSGMSSHASRPPREKDSDDEIPLRLGRRPSNKEPIVASDSVPLAIAMSSSMVSPPNGASAGGHVLEMPMGTAPLPPIRTRKTQHTVHSSPKPKPKGPLVDVIGEMQNDPLDRTGETVNKSAFGPPLVPLTKSDLDKIPGVDISKYVTKQKEQKKMDIKKCQTCGCADFARNPFREKSCANCFHVHDK